MPFVKLINIKEKHIMYRKFYEIPLLILFFIIAINAQNTRRNSENPGISQKSAEQTETERELKRLKQEDNPDNLEKIIALNKKLGEITGNSSIQYSSGNNKTQFGLINFNSLSTGGYNDFIQNTRIYSNPNRNIKGIAAAIEQRGSTAGKIWSVVFYSADSTSPDTFRVYYSLNNGSSWSQFISGNIRPGDFVTADDIDMELVENNSGQKYLWVMFGFKQSSGRKAIGSFVLQVPSPNGTFYNILEWTQSDSLKNYYNVRLTSDNSRYASTPYIFFACSFDSLDGSGNRVNSQKFGRILAPYNMNNPVFSFMAPKFYWYENSSSYSRTSYTDAAYFNNGGNDSVLVSFCGVPDSTKLYFAKCDINGNPPVTHQGAGGNIGGGDPGSYKTYARLSSNGNDNGSIICTFRQLAGGNWNVKYFSSLQYGNFAGSFAESQLLGSVANPNFMPDITGVRNGSTHYIAFTTSSVPDSLNYIALNAGGIINRVNSMNYYSSADQISPKPLFRYQTGDSCLVFYSEDGPRNFISSAGCAGEPIGIFNQQVPSKYKLDQNFPNPFNPSTTISFSLPEKTFVKLKVFDTAGKLVDILTEGFLNSGNYTFDFNAENLASGVYFYKLETEQFSENKKMVLLK